MTSISSTAAAAAAACSARSSSSRGKDKMTPSSDLPSAIFTRRTFFFPRRLSRALTWLFSTSSIALFTLSWSVRIAQMRIISVCLFSFCENDNARSHTIRPSLLKRVLNRLNFELITFVFLSFDAW